MSPGVKINLYFSYLPHIFLQLMAKPIYICPIICIGIASTSDTLIQGDHIAR